MATKAPSPKAPEPADPGARSQQTALAPPGDLPPPEPEVAAKLPDPSKFPVLPGVGVDIITLGQALVRSGYFTDVRQVSQAIVKVLAGQELGIGPIRAMTDIHVMQVEGRSQTTLGATLMASLIKRSGRYDYRTLELTDQACELEFLEIRSENAGTLERRLERVPIGRSRFTMQDAAKAKLAAKANWLQYPRNMLFARAISNGAKWFCSDVFGGAVYTPEEIRDVGPEDGEPSAVAPPAPDSSGKGEPSAAHGSNATPDPGAERARDPIVAAGPSGEDADQRRARDLTMQRIYRAMEQIAMNAEEMRGFAIAGYGKYPEDMPVDMLALLAGKLEKLVDAKVVADGPKP